MVIQQDFQHEYIHINNSIQVKIKLNVHRGNIDVLITRTQFTRSKEVRLMVSFDDDTVRFYDLVGNGFSEKPENSVHRRGYGTLAVNIAIQILQMHSTRDKKIIGILSHPNDSAFSDEKKKDLENGRRVFWERFGLTIIPSPTGPTGYDSLSGLISNLKVVRAKTVEGLFRCDVPITDLFPKMK